MTWQGYGLLFIAALGAGFVDTIAGGGGIITVPALLAAGLPPHLALGTNKLQSVFGSFTASLRYRTAGLASFRRSLAGIVFTALGAAAGTLAVQRFNPELLRSLIPWLLGAIFLYTLLSPALGEGEKGPRLGRYPFFVIFGLAIGFYDGFFGPGTGSFWTIAFVFFLGQGLKQATGHTKIMNFTSNLVSLGFFLVAGLVVVPVGLLMAGGQVLGALLGSRFVVRRQVKYIRWIFLAVVGATILRLLF